MLERSLEIAEVLPGEEGDDEDRKPVCTYCGKRFGKIYQTDKRADRLYGYTALRSFMRNFRLGSLRASRLRNDLLRVERDVKLYSLTDGLGSA